MKSEITKQQNVVSICQHNCIEHINMIIYFLEYIVCIYCESLCNCTVVNVVNS